MAAGNCWRRVSYCGAAHWCFLPAGNCLRRVSYCGDTHWCFMTTGNDSRKVSYGSETQWCFMPTGNDSRRVSYCGAAHWCFLPTGNCSRRVSYESDTHWCFLPTGNDSTGDFSAPLPTLELTMKGTRHSVISSGAACRNGSSGIGTIETPSREISRLHAFCAIAERIQGFQPSK